MFEVHQDDHGEWTVLTAIGDLDVAAAPSLRRTIIESLPRADGNVVIDLSGVHFIDSMGLGALVGGLKRARARGGDLRLAAPSDGVARILELTDLDRAFVVADDATAAMNAEPAAR